MGGPGLTGVLSCLQGKGTASPLYRAGQPWGLLGLGLWSGGDSAAERGSKQGWPTVWSLVGARGPGEGCVGGCQYRSLFAICSLRVSSCSLS